MAKPLGGLFGVTLLLALSAPALGSDYENPLFAYSHRLPSPFTIPQGRLILGTECSLGLTPFFQLSTNLMRDAYQFFNASAKVSLLDYSKVAMGVYLGYETYNSRTLAPTNPDQWIHSWQPGMVASYELVPSLAVFAGGNLNISSNDFTGLVKFSSGFVRGVEVGTDVSWAYNPKKKGKGIGNVLSAGLSYDLDYKLFGFGVSHHWHGFHLGFHYYPGADQYPVQPILAGGGSIDL